MPVVEVRNITELRKIVCTPIFEDGLKKLLSLEERTVPFVMELIQSEIESCSSNAKEYRKRCIKCLSAMCKAYQKLPPSLFLDDITCSDNYPVGGGGFADIYRGTTGMRPVCLKLLRMFVESDLAARNQLVSQFCHEALIWRQLKHPNVLPFLGVNTAIFAPGFCLISPWMDNGDIITYLKNNPTHDRLTSINEIAAGMEYLHSLDPLVVHGDIRGANVLVTNDLHCCLADFGLAVAVESQAITSSSHGIRGSVRWLAPEMIDPSSFVGADASARDVFAFACTVLEIVTGKAPFSNQLVEPAVIFHVMSGRRPERPQDVWCPDEVWCLIERCWAQYPRDRPSARDILCYLEKLRSGDSLSNSFIMLEREQAHDTPDQLPDWLKATRNLITDHLLQTFASPTPEPSAAPPMEYVSTPPRPSTPTQTSFVCDVCSTPTKAKPREARIPGSNLLNVESSMTPRNQTSRTRNARASNVNENGQTLPTPRRKRPVGAIRKARNGSSENRKEKVYDVRGRGASPRVFNVLTDYTSLRKGVSEPRSVPLMAVSARLIRQEQGFIDSESDVTDVDAPAEIHTTGYFKNTTDSTLFLPAMKIMLEGEGPFSKGKFATTWKGTFAYRPVVVKVLRTTRKEDDEPISQDLHDHLRKRISLDHPNISNLLGTNCTLFESSLSLVSPLVANGNLISYLERYPHFDRLNAVTQIAAGIAYLHLLDPPIVHGNIKGANVLITDDFRCALTDFGLPMSAYNPSEPTGPWRGYLVGSFRWLSPEVINQNKLDAAIETPRDIYAYACTILEIMTGEHPFAEIPFEPAVAVAVARGKRPAKPTKPKQGWCPQNIWKLVESCWEQDPDERPSANDIHRYLEDLLTARKQGKPGWELMTLARERGSPADRVPRLSSQRVCKRKRSEEETSPSTKRYLPHEVYSRLFALARYHLSTDFEGSHELSSLLSYDQQAMPRGPVQGIICSHRYRQRIFEILHGAPVSNAAEMYQAVLGDESEVASLIEVILESRHEMLAAEQLKGADAECFMDALQEILDNMECTLVEKLRDRIRALLIKLSKLSTNLPESMFISRVTLVGNRNICGGAFADVYRGTHNGKYVALKRPRLFRGNHSKLYAKFCREAAVWQRLHHKFVMPFVGIDAETFPRQPCMVAPWMFNGTITEFLRKRPESDVEKLLLEVSEGIKYLHSENVVHGDIKGANILIDEECHPRLADFGLTTFADTNGQNTTEHGGTLRWMAPELFSFSGESPRRTFASDIYAFGCLTIEGDHHSAMCLTTPKYSAKSIVENDPAGRVTCQNPCGN
uniref:Protein kinase domain-containing protein n=1 Tax=Moniliophthora roreri TaxID=221103 RepID=A0A0W0FW06_MONRR